MIIAEMSGWCPPFKKIEAGARNPAPNDAKLEMFAYSTLTPRILFVVDRYGYALNAGLSSRALFLPNLDQLWSAWVVRTSCLVPLLTHWTLLDLARLVTETCKLVRDGTLSIVCVVASRIRSTVRSPPCRPSVMFVRKALTALVFLP